MWCGNVRAGTCEHAHSDASTVALLDGGRHLGPEGVLDAHQGYEGEIPLHFLGGVFLPTPGLPCSIGLEGQEDVPVSYCQQPAGTRGVQS